jgi:hypothetical protein
MTPQYILRAAINAMVRGTKEPYCYSAHEPGNGYTNRGESAETRADYLRQLERDATSELENMGYATGYASGHEAPKRGILFANWNLFPRGTDTLLERAGFATEWSDEWHTCECGKAIRTEADSFCWKPEYVIADGDMWCLDCAPEEEEEEEEEEVF